MNVRLLGDNATDRQAYESWVKTHPQGNLWQSMEYAIFQKARLREVRAYIAESDGKIGASALVIVDKTTGGLSTWNIPRGPLWSKESSLTELLDLIVADAKQDKCISLFLSPIQQLKAYLSTRPARSGQLALQASNRHEQADATLIIDLTQSEEQILAQMHQKGRYNIKVAQKSGVTVEQSTDIDAFYELMKDTGTRDGFRVNSLAHYQAFHGRLPGSFLLIARHKKKPVCGLLGVIWNGTGIYYYGASLYASRALMAPYLIQWEAMRLCKQAGCHSYDLLGIEAPGQSKHGWEGITQFKTKFGGKMIMYPPEQELVLRPVIKRGLKLKRKLLG